MFAYWQRATADPGYTAAYGVARIFAAGMHAWACYSRLAVRRIKGGGVSGGAKPRPRKIFELFRLKIAYSSVFLIHNVRNSMMLSQQTEQIYFVFFSPKGRTCPWLRLCYADGQGG